MSRLSKARQTVVIPAEPGVASRPAEVLCPLPPPGQDYFVRNGQYRLFAIPAPPPDSYPRPPAPSCYIMTINNVRYRVCESPFPTVTPVGG